MESGAIDLSRLDGGFDLQSTLESGQTYCWERLDGEMFEDDTLRGGRARYATVIPASMISSGRPEVITVRQADGYLDWESTTDAEPHLRELLRLGDDLDEIIRQSPDLEVFGEACDRFRGMRIVNDPVFPCLVSFICSAQMRVERIQVMQENLRREFGTPVELEGDTFYAFPTPGQLAEASEEELRDCGLGYRAPYVKSTAEMAADGLSPSEAAEMEYLEARDHLKQFMGVGDKVADCVLLFSLGFLNAVPLDTWIRTTIEDYFPECKADGYDEMSRNIRDRFGGEYAGYVQTYIFFHLRTS